MMNRSGLPEQGRPPRTVAPVIGLPPWRARFRHAAFMAALLQLIPLGITAVTALETGVEHSSDNLSLLGLALLTSWGLTTTLYLWLGRDAGQETPP